MNFYNDEYYFLSFPTMDQVREIDIQKDRQVMQGFILGQLILDLGIIKRMYCGKLCKPNKAAYGKLKKIAWSCEELKKRFGDEGVETVHHVVCNDFSAIKVKCCFIKRLTNDLEELRNTDFFNWEEKISVFEKLKKWNGENIKDYIENVQITVNNYYRKACSYHMKKIYQGSYVMDGFSASFKPFADSVSQEIKDKFLNEYNVSLDDIVDFSDFMQKMYCKENIIKLARNITVGNKGRNITSLSYDIRELERRIDLAKKRDNLCYKGEKLSDMECVLNTLLAKKEALLSGLQQDFRVSYMSFDINSGKKEVCEFIISCLKNGFKKFVKNKKCCFGYVLNFEDEKSRFYVVFPTKHPMSKICTKNSEGDIFKILSALMDAVSSKFNEKIEMTRMGKIGFLC